MQTVPATSSIPSTAPPLTGTKGRWQPPPPEEVAGVGGLGSHAAPLRGLGVSPLIQRLMVQRGLSDPTLAHAFLHPKLTDLKDPAELPGCKQAAELIDAAISSGRKTVIYGDYDVDGVTASAILWHTIRACNGLVETYVPHRLEEGYGLNTDALKSILEQSPGALIVSVDCGVTAVEQAKAVKDFGGDLIITDHHHLNHDDLPNAAAIVHPELENDPDASPLCGAGVALKLAWQVAREHCGSDRLAGDLKQLMVDLLPLAALGTVADVVPLVGENRVLTSYGLARIKNTPWLGLNALINVADLRGEKVSAYHVGFVLGPRLNAVGRLGHAAEAVKLLTDANEHEAVAIATGLTRINDQRRRTEKRIFDEAVAQVETHGFETSDQRALVLAAPGIEQLKAQDKAKENFSEGGASSGGGGWHPGVIGIVASRLVERFHRPTVMLALMQDETKGMVAKGSARSLPGVSIVEAFDACAEHLLKHGGHAMAAGLQLEAGKVDAFRGAMVEHINQQLGEDDLIGRVRYDAEAQLRDCCLATCQELERLGPFGASNPAPRFLMRGVRLQRPAQRIGQNGKHLRLMLIDGDGQDAHVQPAVAFGFGDHAEQLAGGVTVDLIAEIKINDFRGLRKADLHLIDFRLA